MKEWYLDDKGLISEDLWKEEIEKLKSSVEEKGELQDEKSKIMSLMKESIYTAMKKRLTKNTSILFSGGIDSTYLALIAKNLGFTPNLITIGFHDENQKFPEDVTYAKKAAEFLKLPHHVFVYDFEKIEFLLKKTAEILGKKLSNVVNVGVGCVEVAAFIELQKLKINEVIGGIGSEEIFAGYDRHEKANNVQEECWNGLFGMYERDLLRDFSLANHFKINTFSPLLDRDVIETAMRISDKYKLDKDDKKIILRDIAEVDELPKEFARRKKSAAQYGSRIDKAIHKLAKRNSMKKKELIESWF